MMPVLSAMRRECQGANACSTVRSWHDLLSPSVHVLPVTARADSKNDIGESPALVVTNAVEMKSPNMYPCDVFGSRLIVIGPASCVRAVQVAPALLERTKPTSSWQVLTGQLVFG